MTIRDEGPPCISLTSIRPKSASSPNVRSRMADAKMQSQFESTSCKTSRRVGPRSQQLQVRRLDVKYVDETILCIGYDHAVVQHKILCATCLSKAHLNSWMQIVEELKENISLTGDEHHHTIYHHRNVSNSNEIIWIHVKSLVKSTCSAARGWH